MKGATNKRSFQFLGDPIGPALGFSGLSFGMKALLIVVTVATVASVVSFTTVTVWTKVTQDEGFSKDHQDLVAVNVSLSNKILETNVTLCNKIMDVNTTLQNQVEDVILIFDAGLAATNVTIQEQVAAINETLCTKIMEGDAALMQDILSLNVSGTNTTLFSQISMLNDTLCAKIMSGDSALYTEIFSMNTTFSNGIASSISSLNNVMGNSSTRNVDIVASGPGIQIHPQPMQHSVALENTGVVTVNSVSSLVGSHDLLVTGIGMIAVNSHPLTSTIEIDGTALSASISNLQMQNNMQQMEIAILEGNVTSLQTEISNLQMMGNMIAQDLNGTTHTVNMTLMELLMEVMTLQSTVTTLQAQVNSLSSGSVPPGTISPFGGTVVPSGYLLCDGSQYLMADYLALYNVIGTMYCNGLCSNMSVFKVPDLRGKIPAGQGGTAFSGNLGSSVGAETHILTVTEMPIHSHTHNLGTSAVGDHVHTNPWSGTQLLGCNDGYPFCRRDNGYNFRPDWPIGTTDSGWVAGQSETAEEGGNWPNIYRGNMVGAGGHAHGITGGIQNAGSGGAHNNIQPSLVVKYIIKT